MLRKGKTQQNTPLNSAWGSLSFAGASGELSSMKRWGRKHTEEQQILTTRVASDNELSDFIIHEYQREYGKAQNHQVGLFGRGDSENTGCGDALCLAQL